ncbi:MAG: histidine phosphatase family protein [Waterburya sp.]
MKSLALFLAIGLTTAVSLSDTVTVNANESNTPFTTADTSLMAQGGEEMTPGEKANADFEDKMESEEILSELQQGGYVIYFRHAQTEKDYADQVKADVNNCSTQRTLSEEGWQQAISIGNAFAESDIPVGEVITSQYCCAWQTASLAFGQYEKDSALNFLLFEDYTPEQMEEMKANVTPLLTNMPESGTNTVIVGHDELFEVATGIYPDPQGMAYIVKPDGNGGFEVMANMLPEEWSEL